jgi:poly(ADP-ribose) glycohydrolase ARH3
MAENLIDAAKGALLGTFVGDALGMPVEGLPRQRIVEEYGILRGFVEGRLPAGTYTDDTEMAIGLAESLVDCGGFEPADVASKFAANFTLWRGYGSRTCGVMSKLKAGASWERTGTDSWGNGAAMRIAPLGVVFCGSPDLEAHAETCARITHTHANAVAGAVVQAVAVGEAVRRGLLFIERDKQDFQDILVEAASGYGEAMVRPLERLANLRLGEDPESKAATLRSRFPCDVSAVGSVPAAVASFLAADDFEEAVVVAVNAGGDTDTVGAMAGALAGAYFGASSIPADLLAGLAEEDKGRAYVESLGERLGKVARTHEAGQFELDDEGDEADI